MTTHDDLDPSTPIVVGVGQVSDPIDGPDHHRWSAADLGAEAARAALDDAGLPASAIDTVVGVRQFEISHDFATAPLGRADNYPRAVTSRLGADPASAVLEIVGGQAPQKLVTEFAREIAAGHAGTVLLVGAEAISTVRNAKGADDAPDFTETVGGQLEDRGFGIEALVSDYEIAHHLIGPPPKYAMFDHARRARLGLTRPAYAEQIGELFAPFTAVAAANPHAAQPTERSAAELVTVTERNRMIVDPYPRFVVARDQVNQGAAVLLTSVGAAREAGIPEERWVFLHGSSDLQELELLERPDLSASQATVRAATLALERAGIGLDEVDTFDLYSCFAIAVFAVCDGLGLSPNDPRGLTLTGGLPFFGGPGNNYAMHAIAETVAAVRARPGARGFVGANGGLMSKYSVGVYATEPRDFSAGDDPVGDEAAQAELDAAPRVAITEYAEGAPVVATVETYTVSTDWEGNWHGIVIARLSDGSRILALTGIDDDETLEFLRTGEPLGATCTITTEQTSNGKPRNRAHDFTVTR